MKLLTFLLFTTASWLALGENLPQPPPSGIERSKATYFMPSEEDPHEGTWLQWPHNRGWDPQHVKRYQEIWIQLAEALHTGERVHIVVYNWSQRRRVRRLLRKRGLDMSQIDFWNYPTDDVWVRDNGPVFTYNEEDELVVEDWKFNGWGNKADWWYDDYIPVDVARDLDLELVEVDMTNEGGSVEVDGKGTLMAKRSSILNDNRNPGMTQEQAEDYFRTYLGATNFIWLEGEAGLDITDDHIDGTARFVGDHTIVTLERSEFGKVSDYDVLTTARNVDGDPYTMVHLPLSDKTIGDWRGLYINYYVGNEVVIVPIYDDPKDAEATAILQTLYPTRTVHGIDMSELYLDGGAAHCVTQQQPVARRRRQ